jgi:hypothetical protein
MEVQRPGRVNGPSYLHRQTRAALPAQRSNAPSPSVSPIDVVVADFVERAKEINGCEQLAHYVNGICFYSSARMRIRVLLRAY